MRSKGLWVALGTVMVVSFALLGYYGRELYRQAPPIPDRVVTTTGIPLMTGQEIRDGQNVWQSMGGQQVGSIWGHGAYVAPDWSADWLHRESTWLLELWAKRDHGRRFAELDVEAAGSLRARLAAELRTNTWDPETRTVTVSPDRAEAIAAVGAHYAGLFGHEPGLESLRDAYAIPAGTIRDPERQRWMNAFFFWASWTCVTERPGSNVTYTSNWPPDELVGNRPTSQIIGWSVVSVVLLLAGIGALAWYFALRRRKEEAPHTVPERNPLAGLVMTPSMQATLKYFWVVAGLMVAQVGVGGLTAHYGVEGGGFFGIPLAKWLPYAVVRTWHVQLGIFWIATAWLATGLFVAPAISGHEPRFQRAGVNVLFSCLLLIVVGSLFGQWLAVQQRMSLTANFWFGHQGYEYVDLGRFWQIFLFAGLFIWLFLVGRAMLPAFRRAKEGRSLMALFLLSSGAIALFYGAGLMWGRQTHLAIAEYWRWWVVHLWVEGFFEVFATAVIAFLFTRLGLLRTATAGAAVLFATTIFLAGGILGTFHHLYFTGTPTSIMALGATFSALEVVPLVLIGFEAVENLGLAKVRSWVAHYKWPIYFFVAVAFWNLVGAGIFGFLINPPIALYYVQGLNTTPVHGHTALFGVYGMLGIGLMLFCLRGFGGQRPWNETLLRYSFWSLNAGLVLMVVLSLLPVGLLQAWASIEHGMWYARSAEFLQSPLMAKLRWMRIVGDTIFASGMVALGWFILGLQTGRSFERREAAVKGRLVGAAGK